jgi:hypothetical protein
MSSSFGRREFLAMTAAAPLSFQLAYNNAFGLHQAALAQPSRSSDPPLWVKKGIVAASNMEALSFVRRRGGEETNYAEEWRADLCDATVRTLLSQGVNLIIVTLHKGAGLKTEAEDIAVAREFVGVAHQRGLRVGGPAGRGHRHRQGASEPPAGRRDQLMRVVRRIRGSTRISTRTALFSGGWGRGRTPLCRWRR